MQRLLIFTDANNRLTTGLIRGTVQLASTRDMEVCGLVTSRPDAFRSGRVRDARRWMRSLAVAAANPGTRAVSPRRARIDLFRLARELGIPVFVPPAGNPNDPAFVARLPEETGADVALSFYCLTIWKADLLHAFTQAVNYHDGLLPEYKGLGATSFSVYRGERRSGFTFHRMTEGIDAGPILVQGAVDIDERSVLAEVERRKAEAAVAALPRALDLIAAVDPGCAQVGAGSYTSERDYRALTRVARPDLLTAEELRRRIRAFGALRLTIDGVEWRVTRLRPGQPHRPRTVQTANGAFLTADRVRGLPPWFARLRPR